MGVINVPARGAPAENPWDSTKHIGNTMHIVNTKHIENIKHIKSIKHI